MAPPNRLRPYLNDLLQKNLELEHVVADLRHQLTQSFAKWADERKTLTTGCDALMASFAKFRARLDVHPSDLVDSEGEVEQNLDAEQNEEPGEVDNRNGMTETERDHISSVAEDLRERCHALAVELQVKEEELEQSRKKHEAAEEEIQRIQRSFEAKEEELRVALSVAKTDTSDNVPPERTPDTESSEARASSPETEFLNTNDKLALANQDITKLKTLLRQWQHYANEWKKAAQSARAHASEYDKRENDLREQLKAAEEGMVHLDTERKEVQRLTSALADQTAAMEHQHTTCQETLNRVHDLEAMASLLRAHLSPEQLASFDSAQQQAALEPSNSSVSPTSPADASTSKRSDMILLKIPYRSVRKSSGENGSQDDQQNQMPAGSTISLSPVPQINNNPTRNESQSFLWPRKQASLPRHALSTKKHRRCTSDCPGHRLLMMPVNEAMREPRRAKCRLPSEAELAAAAGEEAKRVSDERTGEQGSEAEGRNRRGGSEVPEDAEEPEEGSPQEEGTVQKTGEEDSPRKSDTSNLGKRHRSRLTDGEERARKLRPRFTIIAKPA